jgi:hypothetical protein
VLEFSTAPVSNVFVCAILPIFLVHGSLLAVRH